ncbi:MAG: DNA-formamidopyrimidine glycosylase family protein [Phycisphaerales bacterium]
MPELPDIDVYVEALSRRVVGKSIRRVMVRSVSLLRTAEPPIEEVEGLRVERVSRLGKRIVVGLECELFLVLHLMIAGRLRWHDTPKSPKLGKIDHAAIGFDSGVLVITEASSTKRATLHVVRGREGLAAHDAGGLEPLETEPQAIAARLRATNRTLKRALTDPRALAGIGNAYSDEILHAAGLSPIAHTQKLSDDAMARLIEATATTLREWKRRLREEFGLEGEGPGRFPGPGQITAFRPDFAVHGRYGKPCPTCGTRVARIVRSENEINYCPRCQTDGRVLADRSLSRLLKGDWPDRPEDWE